MKVDGKPKKNVKLKSTTGKPVRFTTKVQLVVWGYAQQFSRYVDIIDETFNTFKWKMVCLCLPIPSINACI